MKSILKAVVIGVAFLLVNSSCATAPKGPLGEGELRLLKLEVPNNGNLKVGMQYWAIVDFEAEGRPEIKRACLYWTGDGPYCMNVNPNSVKYTLPQGYFEIPLQSRPDSNRLECYVEYIREGQRQRSNSVTSYVTGIQ